MPSNNCRRHFVHDGWMQGARICIGGGLWRALRPNRGISLLRMPLPYSTLSIGNVALRV